MAHVFKDKQKLLNRIRRIKGQVEAIEKALDDDESECSAILQTMAACRGAINGLMAEVIGGHIKHHVIPHSSNPSADQAAAAEELIAVVNTYLK